jgi:REP element-mobilizing transposase RayT
MKPIIDLINVDKSFGDVKALKGVSAQIMEGEFFLLTWAFWLWENYFAENNRWI